MICPKCKSTIPRLTDKIIKRGGKHFIISACPSCLFVLKEQTTRFGLGARIAFWIFIIPFGMFLLVAIMTLIPNYIATYFFLFIATIGFCVLLYFNIRTKNRLNNLDINHNVRETNQNQSEFVKDGVIKKDSAPQDPLMNEIRKNTETSISKQDKKGGNKKIKVLIKIFSVIIILIFLFPAIKKMYQSFTDVVMLNNNMANLAIESRASMMIKALGDYYEFTREYPLDLKDDIIVSENQLYELFNGDFEKDNLGKTIKLSDFTYYSNGQTYKLCLKIKRYNKCWQGSGGKND